jgi:DnaJ-class molecular chaperone
METERSGDSVRADEGLAAGDQAPPQDAAAGEDLCPKCHGSGEIDGEECRECGGTGKIIAGIGGG